MVLGRQVPWERGDCWKPQSGEPELEVGRPHAGGLEQYCNEVAVVALPVRMPLSFVALLVCFVVVE